MSGRGGRGGGGRGGGGRGRAPPSGARLLLQRSAKEAGLDEGNLRDLQDITRPKLFPEYEWHSNGRMGHNHPQQQQQQQQHENPMAVPSNSGPDFVGSRSGTAAATTTTTTTKRSASALYLMNKSNTIRMRFQASPFYIRPSQEADVVRYKNKRQQQKHRQNHLADDANRRVLEHMGRSADGRYVPPELLKVAAVVTVSDLGGTEDGNVPVMKSLDDLAAEEEITKKRPRDGTVIPGPDESNVVDEGNLSDGPTQDQDDEEEDVDYTTNYYASDDESDMGDSGGDDEAVF